MPDGSMLFTEQNANNIIKVDRNDNFSTYVENANRTIGLAYDHKGRLRRPFTPRTDRTSWHLMFNLTARSRTEESLS